MTHFNINRLATFVAVAAVAAFVLGGTAMANGAGHGKMGGMNPCAASSKGMNPCGAGGAKAGHDKAKGMNPCAASSKGMKKGMNPCGASSKGMKKGMNPCAASSKGMNPCAAK